MIIGYLGLVLIAITIPVLAMTIMPRPSAARTARHEAAHAALYISKGGIVRSMKIGQASGYTAREPHPHISVDDFVSCTLAGIITNAQLLQADKGYTWRHALDSAYRGESGRGSDARIAEYVGGASYDRYVALDRAAELVAQESAVIDRIAAALLASPGYKLTGAEVMRIATPTTVTV